MQQGGFDIKGEDYLHHFLFLPRHRSPLKPAFKCFSVLPHLTSRMRVFFSKKSKTKQNTKKNSFLAYRKIIMNAYCVTAAASHHCRIMSYVAPCCGACMAAGGGGPPLPPSPVPLVIMILQYPADVSTFLPSFLLSSPPPHLLKTHFSPAGDVE